MLSHLLMDLRSHDFLEQFLTPNDEWNVIPLVGGIRRSSGCSSWYAWWPVVSCLSKDCEWRSGTCEVAGSNACPGAQYTETIVLFFQAQPNPVGWNATTGEWAGEALHAAPIRPTASRRLPVAIGRNRPMLQIVIFVPGRIDRSSNKDGAKLPEQTIYEVPPS